MTPFQKNRSFVHGSKLREQEPRLEGSKTRPRPRLYVPRH